MPESTQNLYAVYLGKMQRIADFKYASAVLQWDQETYLPAGGAEARGRQIATLTEAAHQAFTDPAMGDLLGELSQRSDLSGAEKKNVWLTKDDYLKQIKYSPAFVRELTETVNRSFHSWLEARRKNDFTLFSADLEKLVALKKEETTLLGYTQHPYDALLDEHDRGSNVRQVDQVFDQLREPLQDLLHKIKGRPQVNDSFLKRPYDKNLQWDFGMQLLKDFGFDFSSGRQDLSEHPFTTNFCNRDVRITTRIDEHDFSNMTWSCIHELGHALYEQGLPESGYGLPSGEAASFSIHESQSRLWENHIGRSLSFCQHYLPGLQKIFPEALSGVSVEDFFRGINKVTPSLIRTEADELTYHFHVMIRYEIEKKLLEGNIPVKEIPHYWNEHYREYLGITVPDDRQGCLQDVHWSHGSFGYFPSYSLGSLYAAQFYAAARKALPQLDDDVRKGHTQPLLSWLRTVLHREGRLLTSEELCMKITGLPLDPGFFMRYLLDKYQTIYQF